MSVAVTPGSPGTSDKHVTVVSDGMILSTGAMLSAIVTNCSCVISLPAQSDTVQLFVTLPDPTHVGATLWL